MIKKRIKRALRAMGLVKPAPGSLAAPRTPPNPAQARAIVTSLFQTLLSREPTAKELDAQGGRLASGRLGEVELVQSLVGSPEFGTRFSQIPTVARSLSSAILGTLARIEDPAAIAAYANGFIGGLPASAIMQEICGSPDFRQARSVAPGVVAGPGPISLAGTSTPAFTEIAQMIEGLIVGRMIMEGAILGLPPIVSGETPPTSPEQMVALIRTLDMLADRPNA